MSSKSLPPMMPLFTHKECIILTPVQSHDSVVVRLQATTALNDAKSTETTPFPRAVQQLILDYGISRLFLQTGSSSSSTYSADDFLQDEYSLGPSGVSLTLELQDATKLEALLEALESSRFSLLAPWSDSIHQARLHRHVYTSKVSEDTNDSKRQRLQVILPLEGSAVALEGVREFSSGANVCAKQQGVFAEQYSKDYSTVLLGDSNTIRVSQKSRRSMWIDVQSSCKSEENDVNVSASCDIALKRGIQYGVVVSQTDSNSQLTEATAIPLSKLLPFSDSSFRDCSTSFASKSNTDNDNNKTRLSILQMSKEKGKFDESMIVKERSITDWSVDTTTIDMNLGKLSFRHQDSSQPKRLEANRLLLRPNGVANSGTIITTIQSSLMCPVTVQVMEILPPLLMPLWDTWTLTHTTTTMGSKPILTPQPDGTIVVKYNVTLDPMTEMRVALDYEPVLLPFQQFPADPNRGIEMPPTLFTFRNECADTLEHTYSSIISLYSAPLLIMPPVPDMSMPFNVISLTCTLYAFVLGSMANLLVRKASRRIKLKLHPEENKSKLQQLKEKLRDKFGGLNRRVGMVMLL